MKKIIASVLCAPALLLGGCDVIMDLAQDQLLSSAVNYGVNKAISGGNKSSTTTNTSNTRTSSAQSMTPEWMVERWRASAAKTPDAVAQEWITAINNNSSNRNDLIERARLQYAAFLLVETGSDLDLVLANGYRSVKTWDMSVAQNPSLSDHFPKTYGASAEVVYTRLSSEGVRIAGSDLLRRMMRTHLEGLRRAWPQIASGRPTPTKMVVPESFKTQVSSSLDLSHLAGFGSNASAASQEEVREVPSGPTLIGFTIGERRMPVFRNSDGSLYTFDANGQQIDGATVPWTPTDGNP